MSNVISRRQERLAEAMKQGGLEILALNPGPSLVYLTGLHFHLMERPVVWLYRPGMRPAMVMPEFESGKITESGLDIQVFSYTETLSTWDEAFSRAAEYLAMPGSSVGVEPRWLRVLELRYLEAAASQATFISADDVLAKLRMTKDAAELDLMRKAVQVAQTALENTLPFVREGVTEQELAAELTANMLRAGSESELPFPPIVAFGANSANPHAVPTERKLARGELVLFDWGANVQGYFSDLTRVYVLSDPDPEMEKIARIVSEANRAALSIAQPGVEAGALDRAARRHIEEAGYGDYFTHRTGHGLGLEAHEDPYIRGDNTLILEPGMTFTIEPGIYLPGRGGVRIEDDVVITETGAESLTTMPHALKRL